MCTSHHDSARAAGHGTRVVLDVLCRQCVVASGELVQMGLSQGLPTLRATCAPVGATIALITLPASTKSLQAERACVQHPSKLCAGNRMFHQYTCQAHAYTHQRLNAHVHLPERGDRQAHARAELRRTCGCMATPNTHHRSVSSSERSVPSTTS